MPLYEYHCGQCDLTFESLIRSASDQPSCPECRSIEVDKQLSVPAWPKRQAAAGMFPLSAGSSASPSFGCGRPQCGSGVCPASIEPPPFTRRPRSRDAEWRIEQDARQQWPFMMIFGPCFRSHSRTLLFISQTSDTWQPRPLAPRPLSMFQVRSSDPFRLTPRQIEFQRGHVPGLQQIGMDFGTDPGNQPYLHLKHVTRVHDAQLVSQPPYPDRCIASAAARRRVRRHGGTTTGASRVPNRSPSAASAGTPGPYRRLTPSQGAAAAAGHRDRHRSRLVPGFVQFTITSILRCLVSSDSSFRIALNRALSQLRLLSGTSTVSSVAPRPKWIAL